MKANQKYLTVLLAFLLISVFLTACDSLPAEGPQSVKGFAKTESSQQPVSSQPIIVEQAMAISFVCSYGNLGSLAQNSEKIAVVRVLDNGTPDDANGPICTINHLQVIQPILNCEEGELIQHIMPGGIVDGVYHQANHLELLQKDREYLLFMEKEGTGRYVTLNHDEGRFFYENGKVTSAQYNPDWESRGLGGIACISDYTLERVIDKINQIIRQPKPLELALDVDQHEYSTWDAPVTSYPSWQALMDESDAVCTVTMGAFHNGYGEESGPESFYFSAKLGQVYDGNLHGETIHLWTNNFYSDETHTLYEDIDDPWMNEGEQYLVFLKEKSDGLYEIVGRAQGRFALENGNITAMKYRYPTRVTQGLDVENLPLEEWQGRMRELLSFE